MANLLGAQSNIEKLLELHCKKIADIRNNLSASVRLFGDQAAVALADGFRNFNPRAVFTFEIGPRTMHAACLLGVFSAVTVLIKTLLDAGVAPKAAVLLLLIAVACVWLLVPSVRGAGSAPTEEVPRPQTPRPALPDTPAASTAYEPQQRQQQQQQQQQPERRPWTPKPLLCGECNGFLLRVAGGARVCPTCTAKGN